ncbi:MAG TPA: transposase [Ilumatobacteraceae bacterium]|nr:transposase [Ilumatobacteraceae bacterium]
MSDHPNPELPKRPTRRKFDRAYKISILAEWDRCSEHGDKAALLRREGLYSSILSEWRRQARSGELTQQPGRRQPTTAEVERLRLENEQLRIDLARAKVVIEVQGKVRALLDDLSKSADTDPS